jgi:hypothetical protein
MVDGCIWQDTLFNQSQKFRKLLGDQRNRLKGKPDWVLH